MPINPCAGAVLLLFALTGCSQGSTEAAKKYSIDLTKPMTVGQRLNVEWNADIIAEGKGYQGSRLLGTEGSAIRIDMKAKGEVLAVDSKRQATSIRWTITESSASLDGNPVDGVAPGTVAESTNDGESHVTGLPDTIEPRVREVFADLLSASIPESPTEQEGLGTSEPRAIGEEWTPPLAKEFTIIVGGPIFDATKATLTSHARIGEIVPLNEIDHAKTDIEIKADGVTVKEGTNFKLDHAGVTILCSYYTPVEPQAPHTRADFSLELLATGHTENGIRVETEITVRQRLFFREPDAGE